MGAMYIYFFMSRSCAMQTHAYVIILSSGKMRWINIGCLLLMFSYALFFNRNTVAITEKLISGGEVVEGVSGEKKLGVRLEQMPLPKAYEGHTFGQLLVGLLYDEHWLALGLYRSSFSSSCNSSSSSVSYVYTNPPREEVLRPGDLVYVLC